MPIQLLPRSLVLAFALAAPTLALALAGAADAAGADALVPLPPQPPGADALVPLPPQPPGVAWPTREWPSGEPGAGVDRAQLASAIDAAFAPRGRGGLPDTRALVVVQGGRIVAERYADGFGPASRFLSWSMAKSVTLALVGVLVREGKLALDAPADVPAWRGGGDPRGALTLRDLLHMTSGLANGDGELPDSFAARILFGDLARDAAAAAADVPLTFPPGTHWEYSTATSILIAAIAERAAGGQQGLLALMDAELLTPVGVTSLVPEFDAAGTFLGGAFVWANARDWARLGLLFLRGGVYDGRRILPEGWVDFGRTAAPAPNNRVYGAQLWLNREPAPGQWKQIPGAPDSAFMMSGNAGQWVLMIPDRDVVIVRLGELQASGYGEMGNVLGDVARAFPPLAAAAR